LQEKPKQVLDEWILADENEYLIIEHKKLINKYNDLMESYTGIMAEKKG